MKMIRYLKILLVSIIFLSCDSDNNVIPIVTVGGVTNHLVSDIDNNANGSDLRIDFSLNDESNISEFRILVVKAQNSASFNLEIAESVDADNLTIVPVQGIPYRIFLEATTTDVNGELLIEGQAYNIYILTISSSADIENVLSIPSRQFIIAQTDIVLTLVDNLNAATGGVAVDKDGNIFVANIGAAPARGGSTIFKITPEGDASIFVSGQGLNGASGNAFDSKGNLFQSNLNGNSISMITPDGVVSQFTSSGIAGPVGIAIDENDNLYVANCSGNSIQKVTPDGVSTRIASSSLFGCPNGIALGSDGNLYVANFNDNLVLKVAMNGEVSIFAQLPATNNGHITYAGGFFYVVSRGGGRIFKLSMTGDLEPIAGTGSFGNLDGAALEASFTLPNDLAISPDGKILYFNHALPTDGTSNFPSKVRMIRLLE